MHVEDVIVSGSLGWAMFSIYGNPKILEEPFGNPRDALPNDAAWMRAARRSRRISPDRLSIPLDVVRGALEEERAVFRAVDGLCVGMDPDFSKQIRIAAIEQADKQLSNASDGLRQRVVEEFWVPINGKEWDPPSALALTDKAGARACAEIYRGLTDGFVDLVMQDVDQALAGVLDQKGAISDTRQMLIRSGLIGALVRIDMADDIALLTPLFFAEWRRRLRARDLDVETILESIGARVRVRMRSRLRDEKNGGDSKGNPKAGLMSSIEASDSGPEGSDGREEFRSEIEVRLKELSERMLPLDDQRPTRLDAFALGLLSDIKNLFGKGAPSERWDEVFGLCGRLLDALDQIQIESPRRWIVPTSHIRDSIFNLLSGFAAPNGRVVGAWPELTGVMWKRPVTKERGGMPPLASEETRAAEEPHVRVPEPPPIEARRARNSWLFILLLGFGAGAIFATATPLLLSSLGMLLRGIFR